MRQLGSRKINVNNADLIEKIKTNKANHNIEYDKEVIAYKEEALKQLKKLVQKVEEGIYVMNTSNVCKYYCLCYPNSFYTDMSAYMNNHYTKIAGVNTWYEKVDANYVYYEFILRDKIFWLVIYPDFFNSEAQELKKML